MRGIELDGNSKWSEHFTIYGAVAYTEGKYVRFTNAPPPLEETGGPTFKDISGGDLPGISRWAGTLGAEISSDGRLFKKKGAFFLVFDSYARSTFSSNPSPSRYLVVDGYVLVNARIGFRAKEGISLYAWSRNLFDQDYFEQILPGAGNAGHYAGVLGDPRTVGLTVKVELK